MLHEVLLALSGHPSPLFTKPGRADESGISSLLSPSESALLESIGRLAELHRKLREHARWIAAHHQSTICRAVATNIQQRQLARFQKRILDVESKILTKDARIVGAYDIVPLASVVGEFDDWHRLMAWLWQLATRMQPKLGEAEKGCSGAELIDHLRSEANTGFPEIEEAATELSKVAETAWLRQLASWLLYGTLPAHGAQDFFIRKEDGNEIKFRKEKALMPCFVSPTLASSILFIGKSLQQVKQYAERSRVNSVASITRKGEAELRAANLNHLSALSLPIVPAQLARAVSAIRSSLSQNVLQHLLPMEETLKLLACLRRYFLLGQGEFAVALIEQAEARLAARQQAMGRLVQQDPVKALSGLSIKDAELHQALTATWKVLTHYDEHGEDDVLEFATKHVVLAGPVKPSSRPTSSDSVGHGPRVSSVDFNDLLFPTATALSLQIESPLDLFITTNEVETYTSISSYLLAIRRAQVRLSELWRRTGARRVYPSASTHNITRDSKIRTAKRVRETRKVWATCSAAIFMISETAAYFEGEVVRESCEHFETWVTKPTSGAVFANSTASAQSGHAIDMTERDPETLAAAHRSFLASLTYALLLTDMPYTKELRSLLGNVDALIAFFNRLIDVQQKLDLEADAGGESSYTAEEEQRMALQLDRTRKKVDSDLRSVIGCLRNLDHERIGSARYLDGAASASGGFEPWKGGGVDRLLMKLEFGRMRDEAFELV